ncbi:hypothetical protein O1611_g6063 [Lasiodiplodia mahajangana]|uniref:Uncharacterized protein n=1 Tax=Lasiodiplodia mahajangana TaxID=1108764 RepID=A0ACC2JJM6_9PEZI|nr:hypothetical protein O1611_g6063 [Lasiodiplodia mahajangana]
MFSPKASSGIKTGTKRWPQETQGHISSKVSEQLEHAKELTISSLNLAHNYSAFGSEALVVGCMVYAGRGLLVGCTSPHTLLNENHVEANHEYLDHPSAKLADLDNEDRLTHDEWTAIQQRQQKDEATIIRFVDQVVLGQVRKTYTSIRSKLGSEAAVLHAITTADDIVHHLLAEGLVDAFAGMKAGTSLPTDIQVGLRGEIPRFERGVTLKYYIDIQSFQSYWSTHEHLRDRPIEEIAEAFDKGVTQWAEVPVHFSRVYNPAEAWFTMKFSKKGFNTLTMARSFPPNAYQHQRILWVCPPALWLKYIGELDRTFEHEIGHILGLRHENPTEPEAMESPSVTFGQRNLLSIMRIASGMCITNQDVTECVDFYNYPHEEFNGLQIVEVKPVYPSPE